MTKSNIQKQLDKLAHDLRNPMHSAHLNLQAAQMLADSWPDAKGQRLSKHLSMIAAELEHLQRIVAIAVEQWKAS